LHSAAHPDAVLAKFSRGGPTHTAGRRAPRCPFEGQRVVGPHVLTPRAAVHVAGQPAFALLYSPPTHVSERRPSGRSGAANARQSWGLVVAAGQPRWQASARNRSGLGAIISPCGVAGETGPAAGARAVPIEKGQSGSSPRKGAAARCLAASNRGIRRACQNWACERVLGILIPVIRGSVGWTYVRPPERGGLWRIRKVLRDRKQKPHTSGSTRGNHNMLANTVHIYPSLAWRPQPIRPVSLRRAEPP
jgi:hypothetical protein